VGLRPQIITPSLNKLFVYLGRAGYSSFEKKQRKIRAGKYTITETPRLPESRPTQIHKHPHQKKKEKKKYFSFLKETFRK